MAGTLIFQTLHGSRAYGLHTPESDTDIKGVLVGPAAWYHGFLRAPEQVELSADHVHYEVRKFMRLATANNPSILEVLFAHPDDHRLVTPAGRLLLDAKPRFLSRRVRDSFAGYALSQLKRIRTHRRWLLDPPKAEPTREAYGLPAQRTLSRDQQGAAERMLERDLIQEEQLPLNFLELLNNEKRYQSARREWKQHRQWLKQRNARRATLEARFGYDTKHALHLVRLLRMALETLQTGQVNVRRADRDELLAIKAGVWTYDELMEHAEGLQAQVRLAAETSSLPKAPDEQALSELCGQIVEQVIAGR